MKPLLVSLLLMLPFTAAIVTSYPPAAKVSAADATDAERYKQFYRYVGYNESTQGILCVGRKGPSEYSTIMEFPSGFMGIPDGIYDCRRGPDGVPVMTPRPDPKR